MKKLTLRKETLAELSPDELALIDGAQPPQPTPPVSMQLICIVNRVTTCIAIETLSCTCNPI